MNASFSAMIVPGVLWALVFFSVLSWGLLLIKSAQYLRLKSQNKQFTRAFWAAPDLLTAAEHSTQYPGSLARIANSGFEAMASEEKPRTAQQLAHTINRQDRLERNLRQQIQKERRALEAGQAILASIGSTPPSSACSVLCGASWKRCKASVPAARPAWKPWPAPSATR